MFTLVGALYFTICLIYLLECTHSNSETKRIKRQSDFFGDFDKDDQNGGNKSSRQHLPFPHDPADFWSFAMKKQFFSPGHILLGGIPFPLFKSPGGVKFKTGPFIGALVASPGVGLHDDNSQIQVLLHVTDFTFFNLEGNVIMEYDNHGRTKPEPSAIITMNPESVITKFAQDFGNPIKWPSINEEYENDQLKFLNRYLALFYPATLEFNFNIKIYPPVVDVNVTGEAETDAEAEAGAKGDADADGSAHSRRKRGVVFDGLHTSTLINSEPIKLSAFNGSFPPDELGFSIATPPIELIDPLVNETIVLIEKMTVFLAHGHEEKDCQIATNSKLGIKFIKEQFDMWGRDESGNIKLLGQGKGSPDDVNTESKAPKGTGEVETDAQTKTKHPKAEVEVDQPEPTAKVVHDEPTHKTKTPKVNDGKPDKEKPKKMKKPQNGDEDNPFHTW